MTVLTGEKSPVLLGFPGPVKRDGADSPPTPRQLPGAAPWPEAPGRVTTR